MTQTILGLRIATCLLWLTAAAAATATPVELDPNPDALVQAMQGHRIVLLGEVHDNAIQHALRVAALRQWVEQGARPALAFEQFDREHQPDIERARRAATAAVSMASGAPDCSGPRHGPGVPAAETMRARASWWRSTPQIRQVEIRLSSQAVRCELGWKPRSKEPSGCSTI